MRKLSVALSMAFTLIAATAISAFCANVVGEVPGPSRGPLSGVQLSRTNPPSRCWRKRVHKRIRWFPTVC